MFDTLANWFASTGFAPHGYCFLWSPWLLRVDVASDLVTATSYLSIPYTLWYFVQKRPDVPFRWAFVMFGLFVLACGSTHLFEVWNIWHADYWPEAGAKAITAGVSAATAVLLWRLMPKALAMPTNLQLETAVTALNDEVTRRKQAESALLVTNEALERRVAERTAELEKTMDALRKSESRFRSLTEMSSDYYWETDAEHRFTVHDLYAKGRSGWTAASRIGRTRWELPSLSPDEAGWQAHRTTLDARQPFRKFEFSRLEPDGTVHHFSISGEALFDGSGTFKGYRGVGAEITERRLAEQKALENEHRLQVALRHINMAVFHQDRALRYTWMYHPQLGYRPEEVVGHTDAELLPPEAARRVTEIKQRVLDTGQSAHEEVSVAVKAAAFIYELTAEPLRGADGAIIGLTGVTLDITERKASEEALKRELERHQKLMETAMDGIHIVDTNGRLLEANLAFRRMLGYERDEVNGLHIADWAAEWNREQVRDKIANLLEGSEIFEARFRRKDGSLFDAEVSVNPVKIAGESCFYAAARDISARKAAARRIDHLTRLYAILSQTNTAIVYTRSEQELFDRICRLAVEHGGMLGSIIRIADVEARVLRPVAYSENMRSVVERGVIDFDPASPHFNGQIATAFLDDRIVILDVFGVTNPEDPWQVAAHEAGIRSGALLPIRRGGKPVGLLALSASEPHFFDQEMLSLLEEMVADIAFALDNFEYERRRKQAEQDLKESEETFRGLIEQSVAGVYIIDGERFHYVNPRGAEIFGYTQEELIGQPILTCVDGQDQALVAENVRRRLSDDVRTVQYNFTGRRKDGSKIIIGVHGSRARVEGRPMVVSIAQDISEREQAQRRIRAYIEELESAMLSTVQAVSVMVELRDPYTAGHERRVAALARAIGVELGLADETLKGLELAATVHDIGKISIPAEILAKPTKLTALEYSIIKTHPQQGYEILKGVNFPWPIAQVILQHHERMDGSGYPQGLKGEAIILEARILAVADTVEAMGSHRPYRPTRGIEAALEEVERFRGVRYDAQAVDVCLRLFREKGHRVWD